jgi:hypothetical protein
MSTVPSELARLLEHPAIWRGTSVARTETLSTGFSALDERLPGRGWPRSGLIEILVSRFGVGELTLLLPALAALTRLPMARWCVWVAPPLEPFAPSLAAQGVVLERVLVVRSADEAPWAFEQSLGSGACDIVMAWSPALCSSAAPDHLCPSVEATERVKKPRAKEIRRLQLAAERGRTLGVLFRPLQAARQSSHAVVRMAIEPATRGIRLTVLKSRGGVRGSLELDWQAARS